MDHKELVELDHQYTMQTYGRFDVDIDHGKGATLYDLAGKEYIDFSSGIGVNSIGYANEKWVAAITEQAKKLGHISNLFYSQPYAQLAKKLCERTGMSAAFSATPAPRPMRASSRWPANTPLTSTARGEAPSLP